MTINLSQQDGSTYDLDFLTSFTDLRCFRLTGYGTSDDIKFTTGHHELHDLPVNRNIEILGLHYPHMCHTCLRRMIESFPNLRSLHLSKMNLSDDILHLIFEKLPHLRTLKVSDQTNITNNAFTGTNALSNLRGLRSLELNDIPNLTEKSIIKSFYLPELRKLSLLRFHGNLSKSTMEALVHGCPVIEELTLAGNNSLTDDGIRIVAENLRRLRLLNIRAFDKLTVNAWKHLAGSCKQLEELECYECNFPETSRDLLFDKIPTLKSIQHDWRVGTYYRDIPNLTKDDCEQEEPKSFKWSKFFKLNWFKKRI